MVPFGKCLSFKNGELASVCQSLGIWGVGKGISGYKEQGEESYDDGIALDLELVLDPQISTCDKTMCK